MLKGEFMLNGFIAIKPENEVAKQLQLLDHLRDDDHVARYRAFEDWFKHTQDIPGAFYLWIVEHLFRDNELVGGELESTASGRPRAHRLSGQPARRARRTTSRRPTRSSRSPTPSSTPPRTSSSASTSGGHLGLFMGTEALRDHWPVVMAAVLEHSRHRSTRPARREGQAVTPKARAIPAPSAYAPDLQRPGPSRGQLAGP